MFALTLSMSMSNQQEENSYHQLQCCHCSLTLHAAVIEMVKQSGLHVQLHEFPLQSNEKDF